MDMAKYKPLFLSETGEHLDALEADLVELERHPGDIGRIHEVFRHLHSVKSMSASMGYDPLSKLAHLLEDLVAPHREHNSSINADEVDLLLEGLDELRDQLGAAASDRPLAEPPEQLLRSIQAACARAADQLDERAAPIAPAPAAAKSLTPAGDLDPAPGGPAYWIEVQVSQDCSLPAVRAFVAYKRLSALGRVLQTEPALDQLRAGQLPMRQLRILLSTRRSPEQLRRVTQTVPELERVEIEPSPWPGPQAQPPRPAAGPAPPPDPAASTIRVRTDLLDFFIDSVGELITLRSQFEELSERIEAPALREGVRRLGRVVRKLQDRVMEVRMVPVSLLTARLPRVSRDVARNRGKQVEFVTEGEGVELDRALIEALDTPLLHLLRNAVEHGIEPPAARQAAGKPATGTVLLTVQRQQDRVLLRLSDDGAGIDAKRVAARASQAGLVPAGRSLTRAEQLDLIFQPGLSTRQGVSDLSGRGVGLDVVRNTIERLGGRVSVDSEPGHGTTFSLDLPMTLAILQTLLVQAGGHLLALPASRVLRAVAVHEGQIRAEASGAVLTLGSRRFPYVALEQLLGPCDPQAPPSEVLLVGSHDQPELALGVERVTGHRETVLKAVGRLLRELGPYNASTVLGDGRPVLILDVDALLQRAAARDRRERPGAEA